MKKEFNLKQGKKVICQNCLYEIRNILSLMEREKKTNIESLRCPKCNKKTLI